MVRGSILAGVLLAAAPALAEVDTSSANYMLPHCQQFLNPEPQELRNLTSMGLCAGIVRGIAFLAEYSDVGGLAFSGEGVMTAANRRWRCLDIPEHVTLGQEIRVVVRYIEARPSRMHEPFNSLALEALFDAWPCRD
jgi:hypothetical protein